jgi:hypothetical protein
MAPRTVRNHGLDRFYQRQMGWFEEMHDSGVAVAIPAALHYCGEYDLQAPKWLIRAADDLLCSLLRREKSNKRGRACGHVARYRQDMIDHARWSEVQVVRQKQIEIKEQVDELRAMANPPKVVLAERQKMLDWVGRTLRRAFECAAMLLEGTNAYGSPEAIKRSYFEVIRNDREQKRPLRYHVLDARFLARLGIEFEVGVRPGRKTVPLYDLTLK